MNEILFYLYLADFSQSLNTVLFAIGVMLTIAVIFTFLVSAANIADGYRGDKDAAFKENYKKLRWLWLCGALFLVSTLLPSKQFLYIAAGGTAAVKALDSELGKKVQTLVNQKLDEIIQPVKKEGK